MIREQARIESEAKQRDAELKVMAAHNDEDLRHFLEHVKEDIMAIEGPLLESHQKDTIALISHEELDPIRARLSKIERTQMSTQSPIRAVANAQVVRGVGASRGVNSSFSPSQVVGVRDDDTPSTDIKQWQQEHQQMVENLKYRRDFYLRKTPMDLRIEALMTQYNCTREVAQQKYQKEIYKNSDAILASGIGQSKAADGSVQPAHQMLHRLYEKAAEGGL